MMRLHPHTHERMQERGATEEEIQATVAPGEQFEQEWRGRPYRTKQVEAYAVQEGADWLVITVITRYF